MTADIKNSVVLPGLKRNQAPRFPSDESLGYCRMSLWDKTYGRTLKYKDAPKAKDSHRPLANSPLINELNGDQRPQ